ncbi:MAG: DUF4097 family beta strand repeat-containing protein [Bacteroidia bacterium]|nr:DUF4097 family beta strand repeat-containing protein [Bacteroidia bacterium]
MKRIPIFILLLSLLSSTFAQHRYEIPMAEKGELSIDVYDASIRVIGVAGKNASVEILKEGSEKPASNKEIPHYDVKKEGNKLQIVKKESYRIKNILILVKIPWNFSCKLDTYYGKDLEVSNMKADLLADAYYGNVSVKNCDARIEVNSFEGLLKLDDLKESVIAHNTEGDIQASFQHIPASFSSIFSSNKGNIKIKLNTNEKLLVAMDTYFGKINSQFKLGIPDASELPNPDRKNKLSFRTINQGSKAKVLTIKNYFGNIDLLKN